MTYRVLWASCALHAGGRRSPATSRTSTASRSDCSPVIVTTARPGPSATTSQPPASPSASPSTTYSTRYTCTGSTRTAAGRSASVVALRPIDEVTRHRARLVLGWVSTSTGGYTISVYRPTQPCTPPGSLIRVLALLGGKDGNVTSAWSPCR